MAITLTPIRPLIPQLPPRPKQVPYWEEPCPVCGNVGVNATRGIPQQVWCKNGHKWVKS